MSVVLTINGSPYNYPTTGDEEWGPEATDWAVAVTSGMLQKSGGLFQLLAETDFGASFGLKSIYFKSRTTNPSTVGALRLAVTDGVYWRNNANSANLGLTIDGSDNLLFNGNSFGGVLGVTDTNSINMSISGGNISGDVNLSAASADASTQLVNLSIQVDGLKAQITNSAIFNALPNASGSQTGLLTSSDWTTFNNKQAAGNYITALTGDVTASGPGSAAATLATVNANVGTFTYPSITVNAKGLITAASSGTQVLLPSYELGNLGVAASVAANALTISLKQSDGSTDPASGSGAVRIAFRSSTATTGGFVSRSVTGALSVTVPSGATLGNVNGVAGYTAVYAIDNAGTVELAVSSNCQIDESSLKTTTTIDAAADSYVGFYSTTGRSNVAVRLIAIVYSTQATAGTWATSPSQISVNTGFGITDPNTTWRSYTVAGTWSNNTTYSGFWRRVFDSMEIQATASLTGAPNATNLIIDIPSFVTIDTAKLSSSTAFAPALGFVTILDASVKVVTGTATLADSNSIQLYSADASGDNAISNTISFGNGDKVSIRVFVPITGW